MNKIQKRIIENKYDRRIDRDRGNEEACDASEIVYFLAGGCGVGGDRCFCLFVLLVFNFWFRMLISSHIRTILCVLTLTY